MANLHPTTTAAATTTTMASGGGFVSGLFGQEKENVQRMFLFVDWIDPRCACTSDKQYKTARGKDM
jgi:hypothetical protein